MENKLKLEHLVPYLPYGLKIDRTAETNNPQTAELTSGVISLWEDGYYLEFKPLLRPLSDLTKEIEIDGDEFTPKNRMTSRTRMAIEHNGLDDFHWFAYQDAVKLFSYHFDVFGLIEQGLALNINDYKQ